MKPTQDRQPQSSTNSQPSSLSKSELNLSEKKLAKTFNLNKQKKLFRFGLGIIAGIGSSAIALGYVWYKLEASLPKTIDPVLTYARPETLTIKAADGSLLQETGPVTHEKINLEEVPAILPQAFIASEDRRFYQHDGVDLQGIARATFANLRAGQVVEGGSTISQQLARITFLSQEKSLWRKLKEIIIAHQIDHRFEKPQILESYLNLVYLGSGSYGVADAAWVYFGKSIDELTLSEVATLAGIVPAPSVYSPFTNPELAKQRRNLVLGNMKQQGYITADEAAAAIASPLVTERQQPKYFRRQAHYFTDYIRKELPQYVSPEVLEAGGIIVETTLEPQWQKAAEATIEDGIEQYGKWQKWQQGALVAIDPRTGEIKAMVGGNDFGNNQYNRVTQAQRQPGSTFKTFVYTAAIAAGFSPYKSYLDAEYFVDGYQPKNYQDRYRRSYISLYDALAESINVVALRTMLDIGWNPTIEIAKKMGIESELKPTYSLALGAWEVNLLELTNAYGTLANQGIHQKAYGISRIRDRQGNIIYEANFEPQAAIDEDTAAIMNWMLQGVVNSGTGIPAQIGRPAAGKTGTSDESRDLWFIGYIPQVAAGVWLGNDNNQPTQGTSGTAAELWRKFMLQVVRDLPVEAFPERPSLTNRQPVIEAEALEPKRSYYLRTAESPSYQRTTPSSSEPSSSSSESEGASTTSKPQSTPKPTAPSPTPAPASTPSVTPPKIDKPTEKEPTPRRTRTSPSPALRTRRDWLRERTGR
ncbi:PBP1A family penicillin-binding protein [Pleurocapsales cyanobacterium LEGE 06147]|nr:PBP1A family penicillin-binding protein [Pleurocapsales cyanobacterium LEGE 06147]